LLHGKWRVHILCAMRCGPIRFGQLARTIPRASKKVLTQNLRDLEAAGIIMRTDFSDVVLHIEYELKEDVKDSILALLDHLAEWGNAYLDDGRGSVFIEEKGKGPAAGTSLLRNSIP
jgi:DNA-binding HxlR family transcriptional regulator